VVLVDTSVWIEHLRSENRHLSELLDRNIVLMHPFVLGELACGRLVNRKAVLALLAATALNAPARLWTSDRALRAVAGGLGLAFAGAGT
jgi:predicted nucleic acid-binding protein